MQTPTGVNTPIVGFEGSNQVYNAIKGDCIEDNRVWENQERPTQTHALWRAG